MMLHGHENLVDDLIFAPDWAVLVLQRLGPARENVEPGGRREGVGQGH